MILGIESSCDDTGIAIVDMDGKVLFEKVISQTEIHQEFGGIVPEFASRAHVQNLQKIIPECKDLIFNKFTNQTLIKIVCATGGPGLLGSLLTGIMFGAGLAHSLQVPFFKINHLEGHLLSPFIEFNDINFPLISFVISGGNCLIVLVKSLGDYVILGQTMDDAPGEVFDKVGRELKLDYPAGVTIDFLAQQGEAEFKLPIPTLAAKYGMNMSFSGLKTATLDLINKKLKDTKDNLSNNNNNKIENQNNQQNNEDERWGCTNTNNTDKKIRNICASFQDVMYKTIYNKLRLALIHTIKERGINIKHIALCGGVAANSSIRNAIDKLAKEFNVIALKPTAKYCTDNATMIAICGLFRYKEYISILSKNNNIKKNNHCNNNTKKGPEQMNDIYDFEQIGKVSANWSIEDVKI